MPTTHVQSGSTLDNTIGIQGVASGGTGRNKSSDGPGFIIQASAGAELSTTPLPVSYLSPTGADQTAAIQALIDVSGPHHVLLGVGTFLVTDTLTINQDRVHISGMGVWATGINFVPTSGKPLFSFVKTGQVLYQCSLSHLAIKSTETTYTKTAVKLTDVSRFHLHNVAIGPAGMWTGAGSIGVQFLGRELSVFGPLIDISADKPVVLSENPNSTLDCDKCHFHDITLTASGNACFKVDSGVNLTAFVLDGSNSFNAGTAGFEYNDLSAGAQSNDDCVISGIRWEQTEAVGWLVQFERTSNVQRGLRIIGCSSGVNSKGIRIKRATRPLVESCVIKVTGVDAVSFETVDVMNLFHNFFLGGSTITATGMTLVAAFVDPADNTEPGYVSMIYVDSTNPNLANAIKFNTLRVDGNAGFGVDASTTAGQFITVEDSANRNTVAVVTNTDGAGASAAGVVRAQSNIAAAQISAFGAGFSSTLWGVAAAGYGSLNNRSSGNGLLVGTLNATPLILGANSIAGLKFDGTNSHPSFPASDKRVTTQFDKTSDTTLANITGLSVNVTAGAKYQFRATLYCTSNASGGVKFAIGGTATATSIIYESELFSAGVSTATGTTRATALATAVGDITAVTSTKCVITGTIVVANAGTLVPMYAQNASFGTASSVLVNSMFEVKEVAA